MKKIKWAWQKIKLFGLLKRNWKVYTQIVSNCKADGLLPIIIAKISTNSIINTYWWKAYDWLVDLWYEKHYRIHHWNNEFAKWKQYINWIESFWSFIKRRLAKFNDIESEKFLCTLKNVSLDLTGDFRIKIFTMRLKGCLKFILILFSFYL